jgi:chromosomal replication initiator protein
MAQSFMEVWPTVVSRLQQRFGLVRTHRWLPYLGVLEEDQDAVCLAAPNDRCAYQARKHLKDIQGLFTELLELKSAVPIKIVVGALSASKELGPVTASGKRARIRPPIQAGKIAKSQLESKGVLNPHNSLPRFAGSGNEVALRFCTNVASHPGGDYNPLFLYGPPGLGKTHLIQGLSLRFKEIFKDKRFAFSTTERLSYHFGLSAQNNNLDIFRSRYRGLDLLVLDDFQVMGRKVAFQTEFMHIFDQMSHCGGQLVLASTVSPRDLPGLSEALRSRIMAGVSVELKQPDYEQRMEILETRQKLLSCNFSRQILSYLAHKIPSNTGDLVGAMTKLSAYARLVDREVDLPCAKRALQEMVGAEQETASPETIARYVSMSLGVSFEAILGGSRKPAVVRARQLAMSLTRHLTSLTLVEIGHAFGQRSTGCVYFALQRIREQVQEDMALKDAALTVAGHFVTGDNILSEL